MRVAVVTYGTEGDARPFLALADGLRLRGHSMLLATDPGAVSPDDASGAEVLPLPGAIRTSLAASLMGEHVRDQAGFLHGASVVRRLLRAHLLEWTELFLEAASGADVLVSSGLALPVAFNAAERLDIPAVVAAPQPFEPTASFTTPVLGRELPRPLRRPVGRLLLQGVWTALRGPINDSRHGIGLAARRRNWHHFPQLIAVSPTLVPRPTDWDERIRLTGDWPLQNPGSYRPPQPLVRFLAEHADPVYVGFGSMPVEPATLAGVIAGLDGRPAVLATGWSGLTREWEDLPATVLPVGHVPHDWLFERVAIAIHHAGAGTTHAAARAALPSIPVPFTADQPFWARRLRQRGIATAPLSPTRMTPAALRDRLAQAPRLRARAHAVAARMAAEDGVAAAIDALEQTVRA